MARKKAYDRDYEDDYGREYRRKKRHRGQRRERSGIEQLLVTILIACVAIFGALTFTNQEEMLVEYAGRVPGPAGKAVLDGAVKAAGWSVILRDQWSKLLEIIPKEYEKEGYKTEDKNFFRDDREIKSGDVAYEFGREVQRIEVHAGGYAVKWLPSWDDGIHIEGENTDKLQAYTEDGTLVVKATRAAALVEEVRKARISFYIPADYVFQSAFFDIGIGTLEGQGLAADNLEMKVGAGDVNLTDFACSQLRADAGAGKIRMTGRIERGGSLSCAAGSILMELKNAEHDFNYELNNVAGRVIAGMTDITGVAKEKKIENGAEGRLVLDCSVGNIEIRFVDL